MSAVDPGGQRVAVVTGGGGGIGAAVAEALGRDGCFVVTVDPLVSLDGTEQLPPAGETTAGRIVAAGGEARASTVSVTDRDAVRDLFAELLAEFGRLDAVVNVAGITRPTSFAKGSEDDWLGVLSVHLDGYRNILGAALPIMAGAGHGRILGVTSGSGWRPADTGAYGCAKRAVAALTWELGRHAPPGVVVNAMSPIAVTRMVTAALARMRPPADAAPARPDGAPTRAAATGGLSLGSMPAPEELGPLGAHLVGDDFSWCNGQVLFAGGSEIAIVDQPRLLEVVRADDVASLAAVVDAVVPGALVPAEDRQSSGGGSNPRFGPIFDPPADDPPADDQPVSVVGTCAVVSDRPAVAAAVTTALAERGVTCIPIDAGTVDPGFDAAAVALGSVADGGDGLDAVVVALGGGSGGAATAVGWEHVLADHDGIVDRIHADAGWARAVADLSARTGRPMRVMTIADAQTSGGRSRAQSSAQLARAARKATDDRVAAFAVSMEVSEADGAGTVGELAAHLVCSAESAPLSGAELVVGDGWFGLRSHPRPAASITFGGPAVPRWLDDTLRAVVDGTHAP